MDTTIRYFCSTPEDKVLTLFPAPTFYQEVAAINRVQTTTVPLDNNFQIDRQALAAHFDDPQYKVLFISNPNNPTGNLFQQEDLLFVLDHFKGVVCIDESYLDYSSSNSMSQFLNQYTNPMVVQSLSKAWGMAGVRLAVAMMNPNWVA